MAGAGEPLRSEDLLRLAGDLYEAALAETGTEPGGDRRARGAYSTPPPLIDLVLDDALGVALDRVNNGLPGYVCDPAAGTGRFLAAAGQRLAAAGADRTAVFTRMLCGVDLDPTAVELCRWCLWLVCGEPGVTVDDFMRTIRVGDGIAGAVRAHVVDGVPDAAFVRAPGDDPAALRAARAENRSQRAARAEPVSIPGCPDHAWALFDLWCAAFVLDKQLGVPSVTDRTLAVFAEHRSSIDPALRERVEAAARSRRFFHWELAYPWVFADDS